MVTTERMEKKRAQILDGARDVFLSEGFDGASMEAIARAAGVSKGTLYTYVKGKDELFTSLVAAYHNRSLEGTFRNLREGDDLRKSLETLAENYLDVLSDPENLALLRVVIGASAKFPALGKVFYETGMQPPLKRLAAFLKDHVASGGKTTCNPELAASQFFGFIRTTAAIPVLIAHEAIPSPERRAEIAGYAVRTLLCDLGYHIVDLADASGT